MTKHTFPDYFYHDAHQKPTHAYDAAALYNETTAIAESQDRHSAWDELMADFGVLQAQFAQFRNRMADYHRNARQGVKHHRRMATPAETAYLASFSPNRHPMMAEAIRAEDERLHGPESRL